MAADNSYKELLKKVKALEEEAAARKKSGIIRDISEHKQHEKEREALIDHLKKSLAKVRKLSGLLPICASCKKIRDDKGYWNQIEAYIRDHSEAEFSHGICPDCTRKLYPEYYRKESEKVRKSNKN
jgi:hypothetical protein